MATKPMLAVLTSGFAAFVRNHTKRQRGQLSVESGLWTMCCYLIWDFEKTTQREGNFLPYIVKTWTGVHYCVVNVHMKACEKIKEDRMERMIF